MDNITYDAFQEAAHARWLLDNENEYKEAILEAAGFKTAAGLRGLLINLIMSGVPAVILWKEFKDLFSEDYLEKFRGNQNKAYNYALRDIDRILRYHSKTTVEVGLPEVIDN